MHTYPNDDIKLRKAMRLNSRRRKATKAMNIRLLICIAAFLLVGCLNNWGILPTDITVLFMLIPVGIGGVILGAYLQFMAGTEKGIF